MSHRKEQSERERIRRLLAKQGIRFNGDKFTKSKVLDLLKYCNSEEFAKPARRQKL